MHSSDYNARTGADLARERPCCSEWLQRRHRRRHRLLHFRRPGSRFTGL